MYTSNMVLKLVDEQNRSGQIGFTLKVSIGGQKFRNHVAIGLFYQTYLRNLHTLNLLYVFQDLDVYGRGAN